MGGIKKFFLQINFLVNGISVGAYLAPMFSVIALLDWDPIYEVFVPESLILESLNFIFMIAYYCFVAGTAAMFDGILMAGVGLAFNCCWLFQNAIHLEQSLPVPRFWMASVPSLFLISGITGFWAIQSGYKAVNKGERGVLIAAVIVTIVSSPMMSVINRLYSSVPDDNFAPFLIKMVLSILSVLTSAYGAWNGFQQNYHKDKDLKFLLIFNYVSIAIGLCQIAVRLIGPRFLSEHVRRIFIGMWNKLVGLIGGRGQRRHPTS